MKRHKWRIRLLAHACLQPSLNDCHNALISFIRTLLIPLASRRMETPAGILSLPLTRRCFFWQLTSLSGRFASTTQTPLSLPTFSVVPRMDPPTEQLFLKCQARCKLQCNMLHPAIGTSFHPLCRKLRLINDMAREYFSDPC